MSVEVKQPTLFLKLKFTVLFPLLLSSLTPTELHLCNSAATEKALDSTFESVVGFSSSGYYSSEGCLGKHCRVLS